MHLTILTVFTEDLLYDRHCSGHGELGCEETNLLEFLSMMDDGQYRK